MIDQREKTLVFCATQDHALVVRDLINQMKTSTDPNYCVRVTANDGALGDQYLRDFPGQREDHPDDPDHVAEAVDRRGCAQRAQHRADAAGEFDDRVQADHRARHAPVRRQGLLHDLRFREGAPPFQRPGVGWRAAGAGANAGTAAGTGATAATVEPAPAPPDADAARPKRSRSSWPTARSARSST